MQAKLDAELTDPPLEGLIEISIRQFELFADETLKNASETIIAATMMIAQRIATFLLLSISRYRVHFLGMEEKGFFT